MSIIVRIIKDQPLNAVESLVLLSVNKENEDQQCIAIARHPKDGPVTFKAIEVVNSINQNIIWIKRGMLNGVNADIIINPQMEITLDPKLVKLDKTSNSNEV